MTETSADAAYQELTTRIAQALEKGETLPCIATPSLDWISEDPAAQARAATACLPCPLAAQCATYARTFKEPQGVWGGTTPTDRGKPQLRRRKIRAEEKR